MPEVSIDLEMVRVTNEKFLEKAEECAPKLKETVVRPAGIVEIKENGDVYPEVIYKDTPDHLSEYQMKKGDHICLDFGDHQVGYVTLKLSSAKSRLRGAKRRCALPAMTTSAAVSALSCC